MIDATCKAIKQATGIDAKLTDFNVSSVTGGIDALGDVVIQLDSDGVRVLVVGSRPMLWKRPPGRTSRPPTASSAPRPGPWAAGWTPLAKLR